MLVDHAPAKCSSMTQKDLVEFDTQLDSADTRQHNGLKEYEAPSLRTFLDKTPAPPAAALGQQTHQDISAASGISSHAQQDVPMPQSPALEASGEQQARLHHSPRLHDPSTSHCLQQLPRSAQEQSAQQHLQAQQYGAEIQQSHATQRLRAAVGGMQSPTQSASRINQQQLSEHEQLRYQQQQQQQLRAAQQQEAMRLLEHQRDELAEYQSNPQHSQQQQSPQMTGSNQLTLQHQPHQHPVDPHHPGHPLHSQWQQQQQRHQQQLRIQQRQQQPEQVMKT